jgi:hypothetical protein
MDEMGEEGHSLLVLTAEKERRQTKPLLNPPPLETNF